MSDQLPRRTANELADALIIRAGHLCGERWELIATRSMMREAAAMLEEQATEIAELKAQVEQGQHDYQKLVDRLAVLRAQVGALRGYARHPELCRYVWPDMTTCTCTCGLSALLTEEPQS